MLLRNLIREIRRRTGLGQKEFGRAIGIDGDTELGFQTTISGYERGRRIPDIRRLERMLALIGLSLSDCLRLPGEEPPASASSDVLVVHGKEPYYKLLTAIYESGNDYYIKAIEGNLYGMLAATGRPLPPGVPPPGAPPPAEVSAQAPIRNRPGPLMKTG